MGRNDVEIDYLVDAAFAKAEIRKLNTLLAENTRKLQQAGNAGAKAHDKQAAAMKGLALRFVGYNLVLNTVMGAQQKLIQLVGDSVSKYREFETRLAEVSTILQEDVDQMARFKVGVESLSVSYGKATSDITKGLYDILSAAFDSRDAMNLLNTSIKASIAGLSDVRTSVKIFTTVLNSYGLAAEQASHVSDVLFQSVVRGKFQFEDLEQALGYVVPIAAQAGISFDELSAALSTATRHGLHIDMTARGLALAIQNIINPSTQAAKAAEKYGIEMNGLALRVMGLEGWFRELKVATDTYGRSVLGELIPNMRSLRVAMVLAGEEGAKGFAEDLKYLEDVSGRTDEALAKIMNTSEFLSNQLKQELEERMRDVGSAWDKVLLSMQEGIIGVTDNWQYFIPHLGQVLQAYDGILQQEEAMVAMNIWESLPFTEETVGQAQLYVQAMTQMEAISKEMEGMDTGSREYKLATVALEALQEVVDKTIESYNKLIGEVKDTQKELGDLEITIDEVAISITDLNKKLVDTITVGWGGYKQAIQGTLNLELEQLKATQIQKDAQHDVKMGLIDSTYEWKTNNEALKEAVAVVREHEEAQKRDKEATERMTIAMRELQIQMLELQLKGMMRRRGMTRSEEKRMKKLQIEQAKLRLENMKNTKQETVEMHDNYNEKQKFIDKFLAKVGEEAYQLKYTYDIQIADLESHIEREHAALETRYGWWAETNQKILNSSDALITQLGDILANPELTLAFKSMGVDVKGMHETAVTRQQSAKEAFTAPGLSTISKQISMFEGMRNAGLPFPDKALGHLRRMQAMMVREQGIPKQFIRGVEYVPETMPAIVHRGEKIVPEGRDVGGTGGTVIQHLTIQVKEIADIGSSEKLSSAIAKAQDEKVMRGGRSSYRVL